MVETYIKDWPGKSARDGGPEHPAAYHMLDVATVAERLIAQAGLPPPMAQALVLLICLHDLGKVTPGFRTMLRPGPPAGRLWHWEWSELLLQYHDRILSTDLGGDRPARFALYAAVAGHHGKPPSIPQSEVGPLLWSLDPAARDDSAAFVSVAAADLWPGASLDGLTKEQAQRLSWWLAGLTTVSDWIGSNADWFPPREAGPSLTEYVEDARRKAAHAVAAAGLHPASPRAGALFDFAPRPMQSACAEVVLPDGPTLAMIEDETGAGKTEAAMILAQRMVLSDKGSGLFLALPTMATADAMFARASDIVGRMLHAPSVALAHGRSALSEGFRGVVGHVAGENEVTCAPWLADGRRKALLAHVGVGTVDQALLGVLPTRFATLRLWGVASKILIVDEVHEMSNPYVARLLERLLEFHAGQGGSAILLTATLPLAQRQRLVNAFARGRDRDPPKVVAAEYPALTVVGEDVATRAVEPLRSSRGPVAVRRLDTAKAALELLSSGAAKGAACVWVRNAVDDAIAAAEALADRGVAVDLIHARYTLFDRKRHEATMLGRFGKDGTGRAGRVLVATQVVESSLDLDFDVMISDLAPMAALIQRAGRLWRHMDKRPWPARPVPEPVLHVLSPDPEVVGTDRWLNEVLDGGAWVYDAAECWRTARVLALEGRIDAPGGLRALIEAVHGQGAEPVPEALVAGEIEAEGRRQAEASHGWQNAVALRHGYRAAGAGHSDTLYPTRLGRPQRVLALSRADAGGRLTPWAGGTGPEAWMLSEVQASKHRLDTLPLPAQDTAAIRAATADWPDWKRDSVTVCPVGTDGEICDGLRYEHGRGLVLGS